MVIPRLHYISQGISPNEHLENIQKACTSGAELVHLLNASSTEVQRYTFKLNENVYSVLEVFINLAIRFHLQCR